MNNNIKTSLLIGALVLSFAVGRFLTPTKIKTEVKTVEVEKVVTIVEKRIITIHEKPDGTKDTTEVVDSVTNSHTDTLAKDSLREEIKNKSTLNVSVLSAMQLPNTAIIYGASVQKSLIGPVTIGAFGFTNKTIGLSLGLNL